jgi:hypothetical protein
MVLQRLLELPIRVVEVANGPATMHSEPLLVAYIDIASERASYAGAANVTRPMARPMAIGSTPDIDRAS